MAARDPPWQEILDKLTQKADRDGLLRSIKSAKTFDFLSTRSLIVSEESGNSL